MSKVISFSISDKYLEKLRSLYPALTDNLAAKQFLTDRLDGSLGNSLDVSLDDKLKTLIESELDGLLEVRLDAVMGKLISSLSDRLSRLEERLDTNLDGRLDDIERLLRLQREASIGSPLPTGEPSPIPNQKNVEAVTEIDEPDKGSIGPVPGDSIEPGKGEGMNPNQAHEYLISKGIENISYYYLNKWAKDGVIDTSPKGKKVQKHLKLINKLYYPIN